MIAVRKGMFYPIAHVSDANFAGNKLDEALVDYLATEFKRFGAHVLIETEF